MTNYIIVLILLFFWTCSSPKKEHSRSSIAAAAYTGPGQPDTVSVHTVSDLDKEFVHKAGMANAGATGTAKLALRFSTDVRVTEFAQLMVKNHGILQQTLKAISAPLAIDVPTRADSMEVELQNKLIIARGKPFDKLYSAAQIQSQDAVVALFQNQIERGTNPLLKKFAEQTLPLLKTQYLKAKGLPVKGN